MKRLSISLVLAGLTFAAGIKAETPYVWSSLPFGGAGYVCSIITCPTEKDLIFARTDVGGAFRWNAADKSWIPIMDWVAENEKGYMGVEGLAIDPRSPNRVYMLGGTSYWDGGKTAILRSEDYGKTFEIVVTSRQFTANGNGMGRGNGERLVVDPNDGRVLFVGTRWHGLFRSEDYGKTWKKVESFPITETDNDTGVCTVVFDGRSGSAGKPTPVLYAGVSIVGRNFFVSRDAGKTWSAIEGLPENYMPQRATLASDGTMYITYGSESGPWNTKFGGLWKLDTKSMKSAEITPEVFPFGTTNRAFGGITVDPKNPKRIACSTINSWLPQDGDAWGDKMFLSTDGGATWKDLGGKRSDGGVPWIGTGNAIHWAGSIEFDPFDTQVLFVVSGNGIFRTENADTAPNWVFTVKGLEETVPLNIESLPGGPLFTVIGDYDGGVYTDVHEYGRIHQPRIGSTSGLAFAAQNPKIMVRSGSRVYYSEDQGTTWSLCGTNLGRKVNGGNLSLSADGKVILWCPERIPGFYRSADKGKNWIEVKGVGFSSFPTADPVNPKVFYAYDPGKGALFVSGDQGKSFKETGSLETGCSTRIRCVPGRSGDIWIAGPKGLFRSTDSGKSFKPVPGPTSCRSVGFGKAAPDAVFPAVYIWGFVDGKEGIHRSTDEGKTWIRINDDENEFGGPGNAQLVTGDANVFGRVYMTTVGRGVILGEPRP